MKRLRKAIFPVGGMGTRFLPATKTIPKEMLTIVDKPLIHYAVDEAISIGCDTLIFITGRHKRSVEDYFDRFPELEAELEAKGKFTALEIVRNILPSNVNCIYLRQSHPLGLGHAVRCAAHLIDDEPFAVILPDDLIAGTSSSCLQQMLEVYKNTKSSVLALEKMPLEALSSYGVITPENPNSNPMKIVDIVEKPVSGKIPSSWAVVGRYILLPEVMWQLNYTPNGVAGEIQLTDAIAASLKNAETYGVPFIGKRFDCGSKHGFLQANVHYSQLCK